MKKQVIFIRNAWLCKVFNEMGLLIFAVPLVAHLAHVSRERAKCVFINVFNMTRVFFYAKGLRAAGVCRCGRCRIESLLFHPEDGKRSNCLSINKPIDQSNKSFGKFSQSNSIRCRISTLSGSFKCKCQSDDVHAKLAPFDTNRTNSEHIRLAPNRFVVSVLIIHIQLEQ